jgi:SpoVK/Ycf46/Vps4 family AAA+-type ATPase
VQLRRIDPAVVAGEKKRVIAREKILEWYDPIPGGMDAVGGLENLKAWLLARSIAYSPAARDYGLPPPKGILLLGVQGCGKSLSAKAISTAWKCPLLRLDLGALKSKFVGESEGNLRKAFKIIEALGRCVVWVDEIEKAMQGATSGSADGGVSADALGAILSWMQERTSDAFVIATANDISSLPPELLRKGRFDEIFFVDTPAYKERIAVLTAALRANSRTADGLDLARVAAATDGFIGSEIATLIPDAMFVAFADGARAITTADLLEAASTVVPLTKTAADKILKLREFAATRARRASPIETADATRSSGRVLDIE